MKTLDALETDHEPRYWNGLHRGYASEALGAWATTNAEHRMVEVVPLRARATNTTKMDDDFDQLAQRWERETAVESFAHRKAMHPAYQEIIAIGPPAVPRILRRLEQRPGHWFWALRALTRQDPAKHADNLRDAREAWLAWARRHGYLAE